MHESPNVVRFNKKCKDGAFEGAYEIWQGLDDFERGDCDLKCIHMLYEYCKTAGYKVTANSLITKFNAIESKEKGLDETNKKRIEGYRSGREKAAMEIAGLIEELNRVDMEQNEIDIHVDFHLKSRGDKYRCTGLKVHIVEIENE